MTISLRLARMIIASHSRKRPTVIRNVSNLRNRLSNTFIPGAACSQNFILPPSIILPSPKEINHVLRSNCSPNCDKPLLNKLRIRKLVASWECSGPPHHSCPYQEIRTPESSRAPTGRKAKSFEEVDFRLHVVSSGQSDARGKIDGSARHLLSCWGGGPYGHKRPPKEQHWEKEAAGK